MLSYLKVENFAVVERAELHFSPNLNVLTGETGTGKSMLIDALSVFMNQKIQESAVRNGKDKMLVEAFFQRGDNEVVLRREIASGDKIRSHSFINGKMVPFKELKTQCEGLLNIYGQKEHSFLLNVSNHRLYLDMYSDGGSILDEIAQITKILKEEMKELEDLRLKNREAHDRMDFIQFQISELQEMGVEDCEEEKLEHRLKILSSSEEILSRSQSFLGDLYQKDRSVYNVLAEHLKNMEYLSQMYPELKNYFEEYQKFYLQLPELSSAISDKIAHQEFDENELNIIENRLLKLGHLKEKYKTDLKGLQQKLDQLEKEKDFFETIDEAVKQREEKISKYLDLYREINHKLRQQREKTARTLSKVVEGELSKLEMKQAQFVVNFIEQDVTLETVSDTGTDKIEFFFTSNPGQRPAPVKDVASGGELSRLMLVLKSVLTDDQDATYIFDEIDTGIGGKTAEFMGEKLKKISAGNQVICISHLPQIASFADKHFRITKEFLKNETYSHADELSEVDRIDEIARLMAGSSVNQDVLNAARSLLNKNSQ